MKIINGNLIKSNRSGVIMHGCNCSGAFGAGFALQVRENYPKAYRAYLKQPIGPEQLGKVQFVEIGNFIKDKPPLVIANCWTQVYYGKKEPYNGAAQHLDYEALGKCIKQVMQYCKDNKTTLHTPFLIGCGLAGGDPIIVEKMIELTQIELDFHEVYAWEYKV